ncbi:hypothetical protein GCM10008090_26800 [Arenicella chitinivorans]|uniref:PEP-CTERM sorting domain-containing protein n=1 Tax=Arenicella chitinivorans TaxID=1329800 RepID=A0A918RXY5_9GAMM|nr:hypothetical protein [Arenicella chitinivorans]GHA15826.1 hypothetical protein GCM10008090_26800 [Arenicella chitinivorans]
MKAFRIFIQSIGWLTLMVSINSHAQTHTLSGNFSLPNGVSSTQSDVIFRIYTLTSTGEAGEFGTGPATVATISQGSRSTFYSLNLQNSTSTVPGQPANYAPFKLGFECLQGCNVDLQTTTQGFWKPAAGVVDSTRAEVFPANSSDLAINITLGNADFFTGSVLFPGGLVAQGGEAITLTITGSSFNNPPVFERQFTAATGQTAWPFMLGLPRINGIGGWNIKLRCSACDQQILPGAQYPTTAAGDPMTLDIALQRFFVKFQNATDLSMTFLAADPASAPAETMLGALFLLLEED